MEFKGRVFITHNQTFRVELDGTDCPHMIDTVFNTFGQSNRLQNKRGSSAFSFMNVIGWLYLMGPSDDDHHFPRIHNRPNTIQHKKRSVIIHTNTQC